MDALTTSSGFLSVVLLLTLLSGSPPDPSPDGASAPWRAVHLGLRSQADRMRADLELAHAGLLARARAAGAGDLVERLSVEPPRERPRGYGVLPEILDDDEAPGSVRPTQQTYSLAWLADEFPADYESAANLAAVAAAEADTPLVSSVDELERLRERLRLLEDHLDYHAGWQPAVAEHAEFFAVRNGMVAAARRVAELRAAGRTTEADGAKRELVDRLAPFRPTPGLALVSNASGHPTLPVTVHTDIADEEFLSAFREAAESAFGDSEAASSRGFAIEIELHRVSPDRLYPEGAPAHGATVDVSEHLERFPEGALVLTTGAAGTHAFTGRAVLLGPSPIGRRTLAHEFAHLLGFEDAYLRGFDGRPQDAFGVVFVEWTGLRDDLMGDPGCGRVTENMIDALIAAYGPDPER